MNVSQVVEFAKEWVEVHGSQVPGFCGAHLTGSLNYAPPDAPFPAYKDVDLNVVLEGTEIYEPREVFYRGLILEYGTLSIERYRSPSMVLSDPELASNLAVDSILSDPTGMLAELHAAVAREYPRRKWVLARCESEKRRTRQALEGISQASSPVEAAYSMWEFIISLTGLIAVANLKPPTHRRGLILMKTLLEKNSSAQLHEGLLELLGLSHLDRARVESYLQDGAEAFDRAVQVTRTPIPGAFKLHAHVRPYAIDGAQEMIDEGYPREAMLWVVLALGFSNSAIQVDAPEDEKSYFQAKFNHLLADMGWGTLHDVRSRLTRAEELAEEFFRVADDIVTLNPEITE